MRYPEFLKQGGRIGFIAPSFGCTDEPYSICFDAALGRLKSMGWDIVEGPNCRKSTGVGKSASPAECGEEINDFFTHDKSDVIISCGGGETMCEDLPYVDFKGLAEAKPKWFMGYSDNTNLTFTLAVMADTASIYGPHAGAFGMRNWHRAVQDAFDLLRGNKLTVSNYDRWELEEKEGDPLDSYNDTEPLDMKLYAPEKQDLREAVSGEIQFSGRLLGGCLDVLVNLCGTPYDRVREFNDRYSGDGVIWFLESCDLSPMGVRRALWQLGQAGWFDKAAGFIFGRPGTYGEETMGLDHCDAVKSCTEQYGVPVIMDADLGHLPPAMPIICGAFGEVRASKKGLTIEMRLI